MNPKFLMLALGNGQFDFFPLLIPQRLGLRLQGFAAYAQGDELDVGVQLA